MKNSSVITESFHGYQAASLIFSDKSFGVKWDEEKFGRPSRLMCRETINF